MPADPLADLQVREYQLVRHLLGSPEYLHHVNWQLRKWAIISVVALLAVLGDAYVYVREPRSNLVVMALFEVTALLFLISAIFWLRTRRCRHRLNERWLTIEAKGVLTALRREQAEKRSNMVK